jgi:hypothetical protein
LLCRKLFGTLVFALISGIATLAQVTARPSSPCSGCHQAQALHHAETPMAQALLPAGDNPTLKSHPNLSVSKGGFTYTIKTAPEGKSDYMVTDGVNTITLPIRWTLGKRMQTWVFERDGRYYESLVSFYPVSDRIDTTVGDEKLSPHTLDEAVGREISSREAKDCFGCHSSNAVVNGKLALDSLQPGVTCEHCHQGASAHFMDALQGNLDSTPSRLKNMPSEDVNNFCGQCHRSWETTIRTGIRGLPNVRFQPYRLENSKCFDGSDRRLSCLTCHDPHVPLVRDDAAHDRTCLACHTSSAKKSAAVAKASTKSCPVAREKCVSCHMPKTKVNTPGGLLTFTDHQIRIVKPGEAYPN